jgi:hypothetical protein
VPAWPLLEITESSTSIRDADGGRERLSCVVFDQAVRDRSASSSVTGPRGRQVAAGSRAAAGWTPARPRRLSRRRDQALRSSQLSSAGWDAGRPLRRCSAARRPRGAEIAWASASPRTGGAAALICVLTTPLGGGDAARPSEPWPAYHATAGLPVVHGTAGVAGAAALPGRQVERHHCLARAAERCRNGELLAEWARCPRVARPDRPPPRQPLIPKSCSRPAPGRRELRYRRRSGSCPAARLVQLDVAERSVLERGSVEPSLSPRSSGGAHRRQRPVDRFARSCGSLVRPGFGAAG